MFSWAFRPFIHFWTKSSEWSILSISFYTEIIFHEYHYIRISVLTDPIDHNFFNYWPKTFLQISYINLVFEKKHMLSLKNNIFKTVFLSPRATYGHLFLSVGPRLSNTTGTHLFPYHMAHLQSFTNKSLKPKPQIFSNYFTLKRLNGRLFRETVYLNENIHMSVVTCYTILRICPCSRDPW